MAGDVSEDWGVKRLKHFVATPITDGAHETPIFLDDSFRKKPLSEGVTRIVTVLSGSPEFNGFCVIKSSHSGLPASKVRYFVGSDTLAKPLSTSVDMLKSAFFIA